MDIGVAFAPARGETVCGDAYTIVEQADDWWVCVVDGLGHGPAAAEASQAATEYVRENPDRDLARTLKNLDDRLRSTRGAAVSLIHGERLTNLVRFAGIGNVELRARTQKPFSPITVPGIVGRGFRKVLVLEHQLAPGDLLVLSTDGLSSRIDLGIQESRKMEELSRLLLQNYHRSSDDGLCVAMRVMEIAS